MSPCVIRSTIRLKGLKRAFKLQLAEKESQHMAANSHDFRKARIKVVFGDYKTHQAGVMFVLFQKTLLTFETENDPHSNREL